MGELGFGFGVRRRLGAVDLDFDLGRRRPESKVEIRNFAFFILDFRFPICDFGFPRRAGRSAGASPVAPAARRRVRGVDFGFRLWISAADFRISTLDSGRRRPKSKSKSTAPSRRPGSADWRAAPPGELAGFAGWSVTDRHVFLSQVHVGKLWVLVFLSSFHLRFVRITASMEFYPSTSLHSPAPHTVSSSCEALIFCFNFFCVENTTISELTPPTDRRREGEPAMLAPPPAPPQRAERACSAVRAPHRAPHRSRSVGTPSTVRSRARAGLLSADNLPACKRCTTRVVEMVAEH